AEQRARAQGSERTRRAASARAEQRAHAQSSERTRRAASAGEEQRAHAQSSERTRRAPSAGEEQRAQAKGGEREERKPGTTCGGTRLSLAGWERVSRIPANSRAVSEILCTAFGGRHGLWRRSRPFWRFQQPRDPLPSPLPQGEGDSHRPSLARAAPRLLPCA